MRLVASLVVVPSANNGRNCETESKESEVGVIGVWCDEGSAAGREAVVVSDCERKTDEVATRANADSEIDATSPTTAQTESLSLSYPKRVIQPRFANANWRGNCSRTTQSIISALGVRLHQSQLCCASSTASNEGEVPNDFKVETNKTEPEECSVWKIELSGWLEDEAQQRRTSTLELLISRPKGSCTAKKASGISNSGGRLSVVGKGQCFFGSFELSGESDPLQVQTAEDVEQGFNVKICCTMNCVLPGIEWPLRPGKRKLVLEGYDWERPGKRLGINLRGRNFLPEPHLAGYTCLPDNKLQILWQIPVIEQGKAVLVTLMVRRKNFNNTHPHHVSNNTHLHNSNSFNAITLSTSAEKLYSQCITDMSFYSSMLGRLSQPLLLCEDLPEGDMGKTSSKLHLKTPSILPTELFARAEFDAQKQTHTVEFPPMAVSSSKCSQYFSYTINNVVPGEYLVKLFVRECTHGASICQGANESNCSASMFTSDEALIKAKLPPLPPQRVCALLYKARTTAAGVCPAVYEAFSVVSWTYSGCRDVKETCSKREKPVCYMLWIEAFEYKNNKWVMFGEASDVEARKKAESDSSILVCLPEVGADSAEALYTKFRVAVKAKGENSESYPSYSTELELPRVKIGKSMSAPEEPEINFENCDEANCVVCGEEIIFSPEYEEVEGLIVGMTTKRGFRVNKHECKKYSGVLHVNDNFNCCPIGLDGCSHLFHLGCALQWSKASKKQQHCRAALAKCPLCLRPYHVMCRHFLDPKRLNDKVLFSTNITAHPESLYKPFPYCTYTNAFLCGIVPEELSADVDSENIALFESITADISHSFRTTRAFTSAYNLGENFLPAAAYVRDMETALQSVNAGVQPDQGLVDA